MKDEHVFFNPFRMLSPRLDDEAKRIEELHEQAVKESITLEEGLLVMISKLIEMSRMLSKSFYSGSESLMNRCGTLAEEVHQQEKILTRDLVSSEVRGEVMKGLIRFPYRMERIGDMLESMLRCSRTKAAQRVPFSDRAHEELDQTFKILGEMMVNLRDALRIPNKVVLETIISDGKRLAQLLEDFKLAHWERLEAGYCSIDASSMYRDVLDSAKSIGEYLVKMSDTLLELGKTDSGSGVA